MCGEPQKTEAVTLGAVSRSASAQTGAGVLWRALYRGAFGGRGSVKCFGRGTKVLRADASLVAVEDVREDFLPGRTAARARCGLAQGIAPLYWVTQKTGMSYVVNGDHSGFGEIEARRGLWVDQRGGNPQRSNGRYGGYDTGFGYSPITAAEYAQKPERFKAHHFGHRRCRDAQGTSR